MAKNSDGENEQLATHWVRFSQSTYTDEDERVELITQALHANIELGLQGYIVITSNLEKFLNIKYEITQYSAQRIRDLIFLFLSDVTTNVNTLFEHSAFNCKAFIKIVVAKYYFMLCYMSFCLVYPNHLVVKPRDQLNTAFDLWTQRFQGPVTINQDAILIDTYHQNGTFENNASLYWDKMWNLMGRPMTISTITYVPYSITTYAV